MARVQRGARGVRCQSLAFGGRIPFMVRVARGARGVSCQSLGFGFGGRIPFRARVKRSELAVSCWSLVYGGRIPFRARVERGAGGVRCWYLIFGFWRAESLLVPGQSEANEVLGVRCLIWVFPGKCQQILAKICAPFSENLREIIRSRTLRILAKAQRGLEVKVRKGILNHQIIRSLKNKTT